MTLLPVFYAHSTFGGAPPRPEQRRFINDLPSFARLVAGIRAQAECDEAWFSRLDTQQELDLEQTLTALADQPPPAAVSTDPYGAPQALAHSHRD